MPKHQTNNPQLQELYDVVRDLPGIRAIDGRSGDILFIANVEVLSGIISRLTGEYDNPHGHAKRYHLTVDDLL